MLSHGSNTRQQNTGSCWCWKYRVLTVGLWSALEIKYYLHHPAHSCSVTVRTVPETAAKKMSEIRKCGYQGPAIPILLEEHKDWWNGKWVLNQIKTVPVAVGFLSLTRAKAQEMVDIPHVDLVSQSPFWPWVNTVWLNSPCARLRADFVLQPTLVIQISAQLSIRQLLTKERFVSIPS